MKKNTIAKKSSKREKETTEERIKQAARKLFTAKGLAAVTTRDIAQMAGINVALLHYYFRSKDKLFKIIMLENLAHFASGLAAIINDENTSIEDKLTMLVATYIDKLTQEPELILFIVNELKSNSTIIMKKIGPETIIHKSYLKKQIMESDYPKQLLSVNPLHIPMNILGLTITPFLMAPIMMKIMNLNQQQFAALMQERKALIPQWIATMVQKGPEKK